ncbi:MAG: adenylate/guanylate cyclase domain-containing protein, partial [Gemmataceae bacterium]
IPAQIQETLRNLKDHGRCEACNLDFEHDFANSVEMIFRAHPEIRSSELGTYCIGGPAHSPHVAAQARLAPGERIALELNLGEGTFRLRGPQLAWVLDFRVDARAPTSLWELKLSRGLEPDQPRSLKPGRQVIALTNDFKQEAVIRVERTAPRDDCLTAARAAALALFRELFPDEVLAPGQLIGVANVSLVVTDLVDSTKLYEELGDNKAFGLIHAHFNLLGERIAREGGAVIKVQGDGLVATFPEPLAAVRAALEFGKDLAGNATTRNLALRVAVHRGPALVATLNDHLDYFGSTMNLAGKLTEHAGAGELILSQAVAGDPAVAEFLQARGQHLQAVEIPWRQQEQQLAHRLPLDKK